MQHTFPTAGPVTLSVELDAGTVTVETGEVTETLVDVEGAAAEHVGVEQRGDSITVLGPRRRTGFMPELRDVGVRVRVPHDSRLLAKLGSADLRASGRLGESSLRSGSGDVTVDRVAGDLMIETGSGDVALTDVEGGLAVRSGSGDVRIERLGGSGTVSTGSGDVRLGATRHPVQVKSGSGDLLVEEPQADVAFNSASGDLVVGRLERGELRATNVSGDIRVGVAAGVPVWADIQTLSGTVRSDLDGAGRPEPGEAHIELRARTVSGDILLEQR